MADKPYSDLLDMPGDGFRFAVGSSSGPHSTVHRIWTAKNSANVYFTSIPVSDQQKVSLHESGKWSHSILTEVAMQYVKRNAERHMAQWTRPEAVIPGWTRAYSITVPRTELRYTTQDLTNVRWAPDPGHGYWVRIEIILLDATGAASTVEFENAFTLGQIAVSDGSRVAVVAQRFKPHPESARTLSAYRDMFIREYGDAATGAPLSLDAMDYPVIALYGEDADGTRTLTELAMSLPPPDVRTICTTPIVDDPARINIRWKNPNLYVGGPVEPIQRSP